MEITNEIKARVFAQYLGQKINLKKEGQAENLILNVHRLHYGMVLNKFGEVKLILKPLSSITDEDAIECLNICLAEDWYSNETEKRAWVDILKTELIDGFGSVQMKIKPYFSMVWKIYQLLQSKGYDLPQYLLGGKTLQEAGLAIYE